MNLTKKRPFRANLQEQPLFGMYDDTYIAPKKPNERLFVCTLFPSYVQKDFTVFQEVCVQLSMYMPFSSGFDLRLKTHGTKK